MYNTILGTLSEFTANLKYEDLPEKVISKANDCFFDFVGCYYGALKIDNNPKILSEIAALNPSNQSTIWGTELRCGIAEAALAMGTVGYHLEYDDGISLSGHWGSASIPASFLSVAAKGGDGRDLICAIAAAYEVGCRISRMFSPRLLKKHIHFPCTMGAFGAAAGYAKGMNSDAGTLCGALSLAGLCPVGTYSTAVNGAKGKCLYSGWPNYLGINMVRLSEMGLTGDMDIMENPDGFSRAIGLSPMTEELAKAALANLGEVYMIMQTYFKPYPCCRWLHAPVYAALKLIKDNKISADDVENIDIGGPEFAMMYNTRTGYDSKVTCQYSIPFSVGAAIYYGRLGVREYESERRLDKGLGKFIERINMHIDSDLQDQFPKVFGVALKMKLYDGRTFSVRQGTPWGPNAPATKEELIEKFRMLTSGVLEKEEIDCWEVLYRNGFEKKGAFEKVLELTGRLR